MNYVRRLSLLIDNEIFNLHTYVKLGQFIWTYETFSFLYNRNEYTKGFSSNCHLNTCTYMGSNVQRPLKKVSN